jgi:hypothetical protein
MTESEILILRALKAQPGQTVAELADLARGGVLHGLVSAGFVEPTERHRGRYRYNITQLGCLKLMMLDAPAGEIAGPRQPVTGGSYTGERSGYIRTTQSPPSRRGDELIDYRAPMIIASKVMPMKGVA